jgi:mRNA interferase MazF
MGRPLVGRPVSRGDIVLVPFPFTDLSTVKRRPAVVLWADPTQIDFTLAFVSSQQVDQVGIGETAVRPTHPEFGLTGLSAASKIRATKLVTLSRDLLRRWLGRLGPLLTADLDRSLIAALGISTAPYVEHGRRDERTRLEALHRAGGIPALLADLGLASGTDTSRANPPGTPASDR